MKPTPLLLISIAWAASGFAQSAPQSPSSMHAWQPSQSKDAAGTYSYTRYTLTGKFVTPPHDALANRPALAVDCIPARDSHHKGRLLAANLLVGTGLKIIYVEPEEIRGMSYYPKVAVQFHTDATEDKQEQWSAGTDKTSASLPKASLEDILRAHTVAVTAEDDQGTEVAMQFDMPEATAVEAACNVDER